MSETWPSFVTKDLGDIDADDVEMLRRWQIYNDQMQAILQACGVHQDADDWWVDDKSGALIGPDPEIERPLSADEIERQSRSVKSFPILRLASRERKQSADALPSRTRSGRFPFVCHPM